MLIPTKHEDLKLNILVLGAEFMKLLKTQSHNIESLFSEMRSQKNLGIDTYYDVLLFLWLSDLIEMDNNTFIRRKISAS